MLNSLQMFALLMAENPMLATIMVGMLGLCVGSFLNVVIYRTPLMMQQSWRYECTVFLNPDANPPQEPKISLSLPRSACPKCNHQIKWYENMPLISWLVLRGKCSSCAEKISMRYPLVELGTLCASLVVFFVFGPTLKMCFALIMTWVLIALTGIDFDTQLLPDRFTLPLAGAGLLINTQSMFVSPTSAIYGYVFGFLMLWVVYFVFKLVTGKVGMGHGDFKLLAALGAWLGAGVLPLIILLSSVVGAVIGIILMRLRDESRPFAFGPYIAIAGWIAMLWGEQIVNSYLSLYR